MKWRVPLLVVCVAVGGGLVGWSLATAEDQQAESKQTEPAKAGDAKSADAKKSRKENKDDPKPTPNARPMLANPLQDLFQNLFGPRAVNPKLRGQAAKPGEKPIDADARDHIDARAPKDRKQSEVLRKASAAIDNKDWPSALELLQNLLGQEEDSVERSSTAGWGSVRERALGLMLQLPAEVVRAYRQRWSTEAQRRLDEAERSGRVDVLAQVATRFLLTDAGASAANRLASRHLERGEYALATRWFKRLAEAHPSIANARSWQLKAASAAQLAGDNAQAERWHNQGQAVNGPSGEDAEQIALGGLLVRISEWWAALPTRLAGQTTLTEWPMFGGIPSRTGIISGGEPLLLPRWRQPLTQIQPLQRQIEMLVEDCRDQSRPTLTVVQPLLIDGLVVLRTLNGVRVFELEQGRMLWSTADRWPAEELIGTGNAAYNPYGQQQVFMNGRGIARAGMNYDFSGAGIDNNPLAQLLFMNGNFGLLSSDGRQLFVVEDDTFVSQVTDLYGGDLEMSRRDMLRRSWSNNRLVSYDLHSGRPLWSGGGVESDEAFHPELPGIFFFGAPVPDGNDLFVIGERDGEIRLYCLQAQTGRLQWAQLLALAEVTIARDIVRRSFTAQVSVSDGLVVCPTTVGWLVAVDRASHQLQWVHRYSTPQPNNARRMPNQALTVMLGGGQRWHPSAPVIVGDAVVYTPQEIFEEQNTRSANLVCVNLHSGTRRWTKPKENWQALNGVTDGKVLLQGPHSLSALSLTDGSVAWNTPITLTDGVPTGLGAITADRWSVPLSSGQVWTMSLKTGSLTSRQWGAPDTRLGNLLLYRDCVLSAHAAGLTCFEQKEAITQQIQQRKERDPQDAVALLTEASILQLERKSPEAWGVLKSVRDDAVPEELRTQYRSTLREVLTAVIEKNPREQAAQLQTLERVIDSPEDRLRWQRLRVEHLRSRGEFVAAFELLAEMARGDVSGSAELLGPPVRSIRLDVWLAGQFAALSNAVSGDARAEMDQHIAAEVQRLGDESSDKRSLALTLFGFHPATREVRWHEIEERIAQRDISQAELALIRITEADDLREAARAWKTLVELYRSLGLPADAATAAGQLSRQGNVELPNGMTAAKWVEREVADGKLTLTPQFVTPDWGLLQFQMQRSIGYQSVSEQIHECTVSENGWPYFAGQRIQYQMMHSPVSSQRLSISRLSDNQLDWSLPLRQKPTSTLGWGVAIRTVGHQMLVFHREVLHLLSPSDRRVVWARSTESRSQMNFDPFQMNRQPPPAFVSGNEFQSRAVNPGEEAARNGLLPLFTAELVGYRGRRTLTVVDAATGQRRWELRDLTSDARLMTTNELIFISSRAWPTGLLLRASDGQELPLDDTLRDRFQKAKLTRGSDLVSLLSQSADGKPRFVVERWNPQRRQTVWKRTYELTDQFTWLDQGNTLGVITQGRQFETLDLDRGEPHMLGTFKADDVPKPNQQRYAIADNDRVFLIVGGNQTNSYSNEFVSLPTNGMLFAFDRRGGGELWRQKVDNQGLVLQQFAVSPVLFFSTRRSEQRGKTNIFTASLLLLDKRTGRKLFDTTFPNQFSGYRGLNLNLADRQLEILTYNDRIRLIGSEPAKSNEAAASEPKAEPK